MISKQEFLRAGDAGFTRAVTKRCVAESLPWSEETKWTKYGPRRMGIYAPSSIIKEEKERLAASAEKRRAAKAKRQERDTALFAKEVTDRYPSCPADEIRQIAAHACEIGSGRVGRSSTADDPVRAAVIAHIRHAHTSYEELLDAGYCPGMDQFDRQLAREDARNAVAAQVYAILAQWEALQEHGRPFDMPEPEGQQRHDAEVHGERCAANLTEGK